MRAEGTAWQIPESARICTLCRGMIYRGEPCLGNRAGFPVVCAACILTAVAPILPGSPGRVVVETAGVSGEPDPGFSLVADGELVGPLAVEAGVPEDQQVPALLSLVCAALEGRAQCSGTAEPRYPTAGDGWCIGPEPQDVWLTCWVRARFYGGKVEEYSTTGKVAGGGWCFAGMDGEREEILEQRGDLKVLAWRPAPERPQLLSAGEVTP